MARKRATLAPAEQPEIFTRHEEPHREREVDDYEKLSPKLAGVEPIAKSRQKIEFPRVGNGASFDYVSFVDPPKGSIEEVREPKIEGPPAQAIGYQSFEAPIDASDRVRSEATGPARDPGNAGN